MKTLHILFCILFVVALGDYKEQNYKDSKKVYTINININGEVPIGEMVNAIFEFERGNSTQKIVGKIKRRGGYSIGFPKHSYEIDFNEDIPLLGLPADDDWILNANYIDKTFLRHVISYELFTDMNKNNIAPKCRFVNIYMNKQYKGLYVLMEKLDKSSLHINGKDANAYIFKEPHIFRQSIENITPQKEGNFHQQTYPKKFRKDQAKYIEKIRDFILESNDSRFTSEVSKKLDINNLIDWHLLLLISNNSDGILKNFYLYRQDKYTPARIAPWDYDHSFGRDGDNELNIDRSFLNVKRSILFERLLKYDWYKKQLKERWHTLNKEGILSIKGLTKRILDKSNFIKKYAETNFEVWPVNSEIYYDENNFDQEIEIMLKFIKLRHRELKKYFNNI